MGEVSWERVFERQTKKKRTRKTMLNDRRAASLVMGCATFDRLNCENILRGGDSYGQGDRRRAQTGVQTLIERKP